MDTREEMKAKLIALRERERCVKQLPAPTYVSREIPEVLYGSLTLGTPVQEYSFTLCCIPSLPPLSRICLDLELPTNPFNKSADKLEIERVVDEVIKRWDAEIEAGLAGHDEPNS